MIWYLKQPVLGQKILVILISAVFFAGFLPLLEVKTLQIEAEVSSLNSNDMPELVISQGNSLSSLSNPNNPLGTVTSIEVIESIVKKAKEKNID
ncbi:MAG: hypothetical protein HYT19_01830, partial [Candidatus Nealsonbacteria bacterium]|nr:hypothetical protein [Candidatus Nealsonbacteria bacterium]